MFSNVKATFLTTAGVQLRGNVVQLPADMINTQDYISASDYCIVKSGWSTLGEIFLNRKRAAVIPRGENSEDIAAMKEIHEKKCAVEIGFEDLKENARGIRRIEYSADTEFGRIYRFLCRNSKIHLCNVDTRRMHAKITAFRYYTENFILVFDNSFSDPDYFLGETIIRCSYRLCGFGLSF